METGRDGNDAPGAVPRPGAERPRSSLPSVRPKTRIDVGSSLPRVSAFVEVASLTLVMAAFLVVLGIAFNIGPFVSAEHTGAGQERASMISGPR
jgi:hypothetical protein